MSVGLAIEQHGAVRHLVLDAPARRHALSVAMLEALRAGLSDVTDDLTGLVIRGRGDVFSAGADFAELTGTGADVAYDDLVTEVRTAIRECPRVVVAAIEGPCLGAAADLALACDIRVMAQDAFIQVPAVRLGLLYSPDALATHARAFPIDALRRLFLIGERFGAADALTAGLAGVVAPSGIAKERATGLLSAITTAQRDAVAATKGLITALLDGTADHDRWQRRRVELLDSPTRRAAIEAARARHLTPTK